MPDTPAMSLEELTEAAARYGMQLARYDELRVPFLAWPTPSRPGEIAVLALDVGGPGSVIADYVRGILAVMAPPCACLVLEAWVADIGRDSPRFAALERGEPPPTPSTLPPEERSDALLVFGEAPDGRASERFYRISPGPGTRLPSPRTFTPEEASFISGGGVMVMRNVFRPLYPPKGA